MSRWVVLDNMSINTMDPTVFNAFVVNGRKQDTLASRTNGSLVVGSAPLKQITRLLIAGTSDYMMIDDLVFKDFYSQASAATSMDTTSQRTYYYRQ